MDWIIGLIDTLDTALVTTIIVYSAIADLHTLQFTVTHTHTRVLSLHYCILVTDFIARTVAVPLNHTFQISLCYSPQNDFSSLPDFQLSTEPSRLFRHLPTANQFCAAIANCLVVISSQSSSTTYSRD
jgi:hypothetical protein